MSFFAWYLLIGVPLTGCFGLSGVQTVLKMRKFRSSKWNSRGLLRQAGDGMRSPYSVSEVCRGGGRPTYCTVYSTEAIYTTEGEATQGGGGLPTGNFGAE
jgi:hypothetical protein